jgi:methylmalonyl-CoA/ethylmalonyl-CoA epimerase
MRNTIGYSGVFGTLALTVIVGAALVAGTAASAGEQGEDRRTFGTRTVTHVGVVVRDVEKAAKAWADVFGVEVSPITETKPIPLAKGQRGDKNAHTKVAKVRFNNMTVELEQPVGGASPWRDFLDKYGEGIHHLAFDVPDLENHVRLLESKGGKRTLGENGGRQAFVDAMPQYGLYFELTKSQNAAPLGTPGPAATHGMKDPARIGVMVRDGDAFRARYVELFDVPVNPAVETKGRVLQFPKDFTGDPQASNREIYVPLDNFWVNLIQPVGGKSPWRDLVDKREGGHYFNFNVDDVEATTALLVKKGGHRTLGNEKAPYAYVDVPPLGVTVLLLTYRPPTPAPSAPAR